MKVHLAYPIFWTACNMAARENPPKSIKTTFAKAKVTCGTCLHTQAFFSRDDKPHDGIVEREIAEKGGLNAAPILSLEEVLSAEIVK